MPPAPNKKPEVQAVPEFWLLTGCKIGFELRPAESMFFSGVAVFQQKPLDAGSVEARRAFAEAANKHFRRRDSVDNYATAGLIYDIPLRYIRRRGTEDLSTAACRMVHALYPAGSPDDWCRVSKSKLLWALGWSDVPPVEDREGQDALLARIEQRLGNIERRLDALEDLHV